VRVRGAMPPWNTAESVATVRIEGGVRVQRSTVAEAWGRPGGGQLVELLERAKVAAIEDKPLR
jgi:hypothetical protein